MANALDRLGERLVQKCGEEGGLASRVARLEERINQLHIQLAGFNTSRFVYMCIHETHKIDMYCKDTKH